jgi:hypothetical protein
MMVIKKRIYAFSWINIFLLGNIASRVAANSKALTIEPNSPNAFRSTFFLGEGGD